MIPFFGFNGFFHIMMFPPLFFQTVIIYLIGIFNVLPFGQVIFQRVHQLKRFFQRTSGHRNNRSHLPSHGDPIDNFFIRINRAVNFSSYHKYTTFLIRVNFVFKAGFILSDKFSRKPLFTHPG